MDCGVNGVTVPVLDARPQNRRLNWWQHCAQVEAKDAEVAKLLEANAALRGELQAALSGQVGSPRLFPRAFTRSWCIL